MISRKADRGVFGRAEVCWEHQLTSKVQSALCPTVLNACGLLGVGGGE